MKPGAYKLLSPEEERSFREWAHVEANWKPGEPISPLWHPVTVDECARLNLEAYDAAHGLERVDRLTPGTFQLTVDTNGAAFEDTAGNPDPVPELVRILRHVASSVSLENLAHVVGHGPPRLTVLDFTERDTNGNRCARVAFQPPWQGAMRDPRP